MCQISVAQCARQAQAVVVCAQDGARVELLAQGRLLCPLCVLDALGRVKTQPELHAFL